MPSRTLLLVIILIIASSGFDLIAQRTISIHQLSQPITIDGVHEPSVWKDANIADDLTQMEPEAGSKASQRSDIYIGQDELYIYISAVLYQDIPIRASIQNRDQLSTSDDSFILIIDTYNDNRSGYGFWVNPLSTQADFRINDDGRNLDTNWDTQWEAEAQVQDDLWVLEMKIPFASIRYKPGSDTWGLNFGRLIRDNFEKVYWSGRLSSDFRISQGGLLTHIKVPGRQSRFTLFPYASVKYDSRETSGFRNFLIPDAGTDLKWQINPNIIADATLNPDFATVEADQEQVNLTRYELRYPEKRLFFQEGNEMYDTRIKTFYSRRIQDILYGGKVIGKAGKYNFNAMNVRTRESGQNSGSPSFFTTARIKRDFLSSSSLGVTAVDKRNDSLHVSTFSSDYMVNLGKKWKLTGQLVASLPGDFRSHSAWFVRFAHESNIHHVHFRYTELGENFLENVNQTGFITDDDRREMDADFIYVWWLNNSAIRFVDFSSRNNIFWARSNGALRSWFLTESVELYFTNRLSIEYGYNNEYKLFNKEYYNYHHMFELGYNTAEWNHASVEYSRGYNFDRDFQRFEFSGQLKLTESLAVLYNADYVSFSPDTSNSSTFINVLSLNYNFTPNLWIEFFGQTRSNTDKIYVYGKVGWRFRPPFGALYLIYTHDEDRMQLLNEKTDILFLKLTLPIRLTGKSSS